MNKQNRPFSALAGYLFDAARLCSLHPINLHSYSKFLVLRRLKERTGARCLIETGTFRGVTTARCAPFFSKIVTIELDRSLAEEAQTFLSRFPHVEVIQGDAVAHLSAILARDDMRDIEVFLDGHFSGGVTAHGEVSEPALTELELISCARNKIAGVVIDDFRLFGTEEGFPTKAELITAIECQFPHPTFDATVHADQVIIARRTPCAN